jgi:hypothetical protein
MQAKYFVLVELGCGQYCGALFYVLSLVEEMNVHDMWFFFSLDISTLQNFINVC